MNALISHLIDKGVRISATPEGDLKIQLGTYVLTDSDKTAIKANKAQILEFLAGGKIACLSSSQERLWFLAQLGFGDQYHVPGFAKIIGDLDVPALEKTVNLLAARHESLRTHFLTVGDTPVQIIRPHVQISLDCLDMSDLSPDAQQVQEKQARQTFLERPFDLANGPLFRVMLIKLAARAYMLCICQHHIITDGWSMRVFVREMAQAYQAFNTGITPNLPALTLDYAAYSVWERETLNPEKLAKELAYWQNQLTGYENLAMPWDFPRPAQSSGQGGYVAFGVGQELGLNIKKISRERKTTAFTLFMAAVYLLLQKYSGQSDICMGMPVANRRQRDLEDIIGFFVNTVIMRINPAETALTVDALLKHVHRVIIEGQDNQNVPVEKILELLQPERDLSRTPIFQVLINYTPLSLGTLEFGNCQLEPLFDFDIKEAKFDLTFTFNEFDNGEASIGIEYSTDLYTPATINQMTAHLTKIMQFFVNAPDADLSGLILIDDKDADTQLQAWNRTAHAYPSGHCLHDLFALQAAKTPGNIAVIYEDQQLTYQQLHEHSWLVAVYLQKQGIGPDMLVALCVNRSPSMIVGLLGILKAGAAYLPIDAAYPSERIKTLLQDSGAKWLLTEQGLLPNLAEAAEALGCQIICLDSDWEKLQQVRGRLAHTAEPDNLAYVIYTSGSTGQPKGVMIEHRNVVNHNLAVIDAYQIQPEDRVLQFSTISFDIFVEEVFPSLLSGAAVVLLDGARFTDINYLKQTISRHRVSLMNLPTAFWHTLVDDRFDPSILKRVIIGGEKAEAEKFKAWQRHNPNITVINTYGPTEATVIALLYPMDGSLPAGRQIPLGRPLANTQIYILDKNLNLMPAGMAGELHIAGAGLARGYLNAPELTRQKFIDNPYAPGSRLYKTGDLARWLPDGQVEYLGRIDHQVKIRGFRVELGEIEAALSGHPDLQAAAVIAKTYNGNKQLVAFYHPKGSASVNAETLKSFLRDSLPDYMIPVACVQLEAIPLTANGKINRKALEQQPVTLSSERDYIAPGNDLEQELARIWESVLGISRAGGQDNFFELGGHSLLTVQLVNQINQLPGISKVNPVDIFKYPTIKGLAGYLQTDEAKTNAATPHAIKLRQKRATFIIPGLPGLTDGYYELAEALRLDGDVYGLQMLGLLEGEQAATTVADMAAHNIAMIRNIQDSGKINLYAHSYGGTVVYEMLKQLQGTGLEVGEIVLIDCGVLASKGRAPVDKPSVRQFCRFLLAGAGVDAEAANQQVKDILDKHPQEEWKYLLANLMQQTGAMDSGQFTKIWQVVEAAVSVSYGYGPQLPYNVTLVIAAASKSWLNPKCWDGYFRNVRVIHSPGEHMTMIRAPHLEAWLPQLNGTAISNAGVVIDPALFDSSVILNVQNLQKEYPGGVKAVNGINFALKEGVCFGLLGPNGAGKSTSLEMMEGIIKPSGGQIYFRGAPIGKEYRKHIGIQFQHTALPDLLTVKESLQLFQKLYPTCLPIEDIIEACSLQDYLNRDNRKLSGGQRQRLLLGIALINDPDIVFLDEPTTGLDPQARHNFWELIRSVKARGKTVILTTHYMDEAEQLCDEIAIMDKGQILVQDTPDNLLKEHFDGVLLRLPKTCGLAELDDLPFDVYAGEEVVEFITPDVEAAIRHLTQRQIALDGLSIAAPNLENLFLKLTGHSLRA
jgi:amino acid adenylation domain-containing protein